MKALTLWQPWASLCVIPRPCVCWAGDGSHLSAGPLTNCRICGNIGDKGPFKTIETRSWKAPDSLIGQRIAIHAAKTVTGLEQCHADPDARPIRDALRPHFSTWGDIPLGAVVGIAVLTDCVPMVGEDGDLTETEPPCLEIRPRGAVNEGLWLWDAEPSDDGPVDVSDQLPFGHFEPGRWAWLLTDVDRFDEPITATGRQGLWNWESPGG